MNDNPKRALAEAEEWLRTAKSLVEIFDERPLSVAVCCAQAIHSLIRANDALTLKYLGKKSIRHDGAPFFFIELIKQNKIEEKEAEFAKLLMKAMREKSGADYGKSVFSKSDAAYFIKETERFLAMAKKYVQ